MRSLIFLSVFMVLQQVLSQDYDYVDDASNTTPQPNLRRRPPQRPVQRPVELPGQRPVELPGQRPVELPGQRPVELPGQRPVELPDQHPAQTSSLHYNKPEGPNEIPQLPKIIRATCNVQPNVNLEGKPTYQPVNGSVILTQELFPAKMGPLHLEINLSGFIPAESNQENTLHGFHIHTFGDIVGGCEAAGSHFNPFNQTHGGPKDKIRHLGDLGNIEVNYDIVSTKIDDERLSLLGPLTIIGRSIVVHEKEDDLGRGGDAESKKTGNAGARLACCVIGLAAPPE